MPRNVNFQEADIATYVRIEARARANDFAPVVKAQVHDALWMLTQQWRIGEFKGEDAGTLIKSKIETQSSFINRFKSRNGAVEAFDHTVPLEAKVERLPIVYDFGLKIEIGFQWYKILLKYGLQNFYTNYLGNYPINDVDNSSDEHLLSNTSVVQIHRLLFNKIIDGGAFAEAIKTQNAWTLIGQSSTTAFVNAQNQFKSWLSRTYYQPASDSENSWSGEHLEYQFKMSTPLSTANGANQILYQGDQYTNGDLDWYSVDVNADVSAKLSETPANSISNNVLPASYGSKPVIGSANVISYIPHTISFKGMPKGRWWEFEDRNIDISKVMTQKQDITKLVLMEFGLIYSNDWFVIPHQLENATVTEIKGLVGTDVFGRQIRVDKAGADDPLLTPMTKWDMYSNNRNVQSNAPYSSLSKLLLMPTLINKVESEPLERVLFLRDEMANMVWAVEDIIPNELFGGMNGKNAADRLIEFLLSQNPSNSPLPSYVPNDALFRYKLSNSVPENWIPFIAARNNDTSRVIKLQRAALLRYLTENSTPERIKPRTNLLSINLDTAPYYVNEEEVSNSGFVITTTFQRTRWFDGSTFVWLGRKRLTGRGEANSGYVFDVLQDKESDL